MLGVECSNHSVPTILFSDLAQSEKVGLFHGCEFCVTCRFFMPASSSKSSEPVCASAWLTPCLQPPSGIQDPSIGPPFGRGLDVTLRDGKGKEGDCRILQWY
ncbi:Uncharacterized membrane-anchored protein YjiN [Pseudomonas syringae pv. actinidiae]|uniref:Uncharacterized membrane-anchored protein YjiN n=1 Tax=Pseudomonas syringae pv. actinidiae TaxID=103796 RepID=A0AAN4Q7N5_PSESF|nr:Uncharacterized membrane-anchored protein YjiN [Pseudomonas syringae pv. actinidiae]